MDTDETLLGERECSEQAEQIGISLCYKISPAIHDNLHIFYKLSKERQN